MMKLTVPTSPRRQATGAAGHLTYSGFAAHGHWRKTIEACVKGGVDRNQLSLPVGRKFGDLDARIGASTADLNRTGR